MKKPKWEGMWKEVKFEFLWKFDNGELILIDQKMKRRIWIREKNSKEIENEAKILR